LLPGDGRREPIAVVVDGQVLTTIAATGVPGLSSRVGRGMSEREARRLAAALLVDTELPVSLTPPEVRLLREFRN